MSKKEKPKKVKERRARESDQESVQTTKAVSILYYLIFVEK